MKIIIILLFMITSVCCNSAEIKSNHELVTYGYFSLESVILNSIQDEAVSVDISGLIVLLGNVDTDESRNLLIKLSNYYFGSAISEALLYSITKHGTKILNKLRDEINTPVNCTSKIKGNDCLNNTERGQLIESYIKLIESGDKIDYLI